MSSGNFEPFTVLVGLGFPRRIGDLDDAIAFLDDYPPALQNQTHRVVLDLCRRAGSGGSQVRAARAAVYNFARVRGILIEEPVAAQALPDKAALGR